jgi:hypothetical protein
VKRVRMLGEAQRGQVWRSSLSGALYRWNGQCWQFQPEGQDDWHTPFDEPVEMYARAGEDFEEVAVDGDAAD